MSDKPFYRFFVIDYCATGEGRSIWLMICRNYNRGDDKDREIEEFVKFVGIGADHYMHGCDELTEREFLDKYTRFMPNLIADMLQKKTIGTWKTHLHFNLS
jgi:hypothetical protein